MRLLKSNALDGPVIAVASIEPHDGLPGPGIVEVTGGGSQLQVPLVRSSFLVRNPVHPEVLYVTRQEPEGGIVAVSPSGVQEAGSGGGTPCHLTVHPEGHWLYVTNYRDAVVRAVRLDQSGRLTETVVDLRYQGSSIHPRRQTSAHAHATSLSPDGRWLVVSDLGSDALHAHRLRDGEPENQAIRTELPAGSGPRHLAWLANTLYVTCELSGDVAVIAWDEQNGLGDVRGLVATTSDPAVESHLLSDLVIVGGTLVAAHRAKSQISVLTIQPDRSLVLAHEVPTLQRPTHLATTNGEVFVAGSDSNSVGRHLLDPEPGPVEEIAAVAEPMCLLVEQHSSVAIS